MEYFKGKAFYAILFFCVTFSDSSRFKIILEGKVQPKIVSGRKPQAEKL